MTATKDERLLWNPEVGVRAEVDVGGIEGVREVTRQVCRSLVSHNEDPCGRARSEGTAQIRKVVELVRQALHTGGGATLQQGERGIRELTDS